MKTKDWMIDDPPWATRVTACQWDDGTRGLMIHSDGAVAHARIPPNSAHEIAEFLIPANGQRNGERSLELADEAYRRVAKILSGAVAGRVERYRRDDGGIKWGVVEYDIFKALREVVAPDGVVDGADAGPGLVHLSLDSDDAAALALLLATAIPLLDGYDFGEQPLEVAAELLAKLREAAP